MTLVTALSTVSVAGVAARWRLTPWDADGLGLPATAELVELDDGPASAQAVVLAALDDDLGARDVALVTTRLAAERTATLAALAVAGWRAVETSHALTLDLAAWSPPPQPASRRRRRAGDRRRRAGPGRAGRHRLRLLAVPRGPADPPRARARAATGAGSSTA
jgi:hypothetical protein